MDGLMPHRALSFAAKAHEGQRRKGSDVPYIVHPVETAAILSREGCGIALITAGLLHDVLEDTQTQESDILRYFGSRVLGLVKSASEDKSQSWERRKEHTIEFLQSGANREQMYLACADKLSNLRSLSIEKDDSGKIDWGRFKRGAGEQEWYYKSILAALSPISQTKMYGELAQLVSKVFG